MRRLFVLLTFFLTAACSGVTETGNPIPVPAGAPNLSAGTQLYENDEYGVSIAYPQEWNCEEVQEDAGGEPNGTDEEPQLAMEDSFSIVFESPADQATTAFISFGHLYTIPESLYAYLADTYPDRKFIHYSTMALSGYLYDDPQTGENGGDLQEYFFLSEDVLVHVKAEVFEADRLRFATLLNGIIFE
jgi:hypothetical protein